jgi:hypothetical protein
MAFIYYFIINSNSTSSNCGVQERPWDLTRRSTVMGLFLVPALSEVASMPERLPVFALRIAFYRFFLSSVISVLRVALVRGQS